MQETTIDFGIDLGTTNSVIGVMNKGEIEIIKNGMSEMTPSCVYINKKGVVRVGMGAKNRLGDIKSTLDVQFEFKKLMGQRVDLSFQSAALSMTPEELSAEVLKELRRAAEGRFDAMPRAAIITIPAMFESPQREATARAGKLAGFEHCQLLQEPVAAAVAYGFRTDTEKAFWLVYDFGGGTFDTSIVAVRDGQLSVVDHGGDNYLGGSDFDWLIVEQVLIPQLQEEYDLPDLSRKNMEDDPGVKARMFVLKAKAEQLKIELSRSSESTLIDDDIFMDDSSESVDLDISLTRDRFNELISSKVDGSTKVVRKLLETANLKPTDIEKVILVGGTTFTPLVREQVEALGMPVDYDLDPMTVVARGAAVFAASQRIPENLMAIERAAGVAKVSLEYQPVSKEVNPLVGGKISLDGGKPPDAGTTLEIKRDDGGWSSGVIPLEEGGMFFTNVMVVENGASSFTISVRDGQGNNIEAVPASFIITHGLSVAKATLPQTIRLVKYDGTTDILLAKGTQLPASIEGHRVHTTKSLTKGNKNEELRIPFCEGEEEQGDRNRMGSRIIIRGDEVERSLPENTELEISAEVDDSGVNHFRVFVPLLDDEFEATGSVLKHEPPDIMERRLQATQQRINNLQEKASEIDDNAAREKLESLQSSQRLTEIRGDVSAWSGGDHSAAGKARNQQVEIDKELDEIEGLVEWPSLLAEYQESLDDARVMVQLNGDNNVLQGLTRLEEEGDRAIEAHDPKMLKSTKIGLDTLWVYIQLDDPETLAAWLYQLADESHRIPDQARAKTLLQEGNQAIDRGDVVALRSVVQQLMTMLPQDVADKIRVMQSGVR